MKLYKFTDQKGCTRENFQYLLPNDGEPSEWTEASNPSKKDGQPCGAGRLHLMTSVCPKYAPSNFRCFEAKGKGFVGGDKEKEAYQKVQLLKELSSPEIDQGMDDDWAEKLGKPNIYLPIAWARTNKYLDRPIDEDWLRNTISPLLGILGKKGKAEVIRASLGNSLWASLEDSLWASLKVSLRDSLGASLWVSLRASLGDSLGDSLGVSLRASLGDSLGDSLFYERGFVLAGKPKPELSKLLEVWKAGACPIGFDKDQNLLVLAKETK